MFEDKNIDLSDIPEITDFSKARKNPYFERIKKYGFSVTEYYSPEDVTEIIKDACNRKINILNMDSEELKAFERYKKTHGYNTD